MDASQYREWLSDYGTQFTLGSFNADDDNAHFKEWREALSPLLIDEGVRRAEDFTAFKARVFKVDVFLGQLYSTLNGVWERYRQNGTTDRDVKFSRPRHWWRHFNLANYLSTGTKDESEYVEVNEDELLALATEYLSMPWLRHPRLDWLFIDALLFFPTLAAAQRLRVTLSQQSMFTGEAFKKAVHGERLSELKWAATKGRWKANVFGTALLWGIGLVAPLVALGWLIEVRPAAWVGWLVGVPSALLLLLTAWSVLWWALGILRRAFGGKDTRPESPKALALRLEREAQAWLDTYDLLSATAIPVDVLRTKLGELPALPNGKSLPPALLALIARLAERDGSVWVPFPR